MINNRSISVCILGLFMSCSVWAKELHYTLKLSNISGKTYSEETGDELFVNIIQYSSLGKSDKKRIPEKPLYWQSRDLSQVKDVVLWEGVIQEKESQKLVIALVEQDSPPWDPNDLIGSAEVNLTNNKGKLIQDWVVPVLEQTDEVEKIQSTPSSREQKFLFKGNDAFYEVTFSIEQQKK